MSSIGRLGSNQRPASSFRPIASKKPSPTLYWPIVTCLLLPGGMRPVLLLLSVLTPMSVRPTADDAGNALHLLDDHLRLRRTAGARSSSSTWRMWSRL